MITAAAFLLLRTVPPLLRDGVASGNYRVYGSIIRDMGSGRIVGHLQETGGLMNMATLVLANPILGPVTLGSSLVANYQNQAILASLEVVQQMQVASLVLNGVGIATSVAGTAILMRRIDRLSEDVKAMHGTVDRIARGVAQLQQELVDRDLASLRTIITHVDHAWMPSGTDGEWRDIASDSLEIANQFNIRIERLIESAGDTGDAAAAIPHIALYAQASELYVTARMAAGQDDMARVAAVQRAEILAKLGAHFTMDRMVIPAPTEPQLRPGDPAWHADRKARWQQCLEQVLRVREREIAAASSIETMEALQEAGIPGKEWLLRARNEETAPLMFLPGPGWEGSMEGAETISLGLPEGPEDPPPEEPLQNDPSVEALPPDVPPTEPPSGLPGRLKQWLHWFTSR